MPRKYTKEDFILKARQVHGWKYDYSKVEYVNSTTKVCIICPKHGEFWQIPYTHLNGCKCSKCSHENGGLKNNKGKEQFIAESNIIHNNKYNYSKTEYKNNKEKVCIICPIHGEFWQTPKNHLKGNGCSKCKYDMFRENMKDTNETFIEKARNVHEDKYDYSKVEYVDSHTKVCIICHEHGEFWQKPNNHIHGWGCAKCSGMMQKTTEEFINASKKIYKNKYDYQNTHYVNNKTPLIITCKQHGDFKVYPNEHLKGQECPYCSMTRLETDIKRVLEKENIEYVWQYKNDFIGNQRLDFYIPKFNIAIECQGIQHFAPIKFFGGDEKLKYQRIMDTKKRNLCKKNGITILYYTKENIFKKYRNLMRKNTFFRVEELVSKIKNS